MKFKELVGEQKARLFSQLIERFGFPAKTFDDFDFYLAKDEIRICAKGMLSAASDILNIQDIGFAFARLGANVKPTTNIVQMIGKFATKNFVRLARDQTFQFISGKDLALEKKQIENCTNGFAIVRFEQDNLGVGFLREQALKNLVPGAKRLDIGKQFEQKD